MYIGILRYKNVTEFIIIININHKFPSLSCLPPGSYLPCCWVTVFLSQVSINYCPSKGFIVQSPCLALRM